MGVRDQSCGFLEPTWSQHVRPTNISDLLKQPTALSFVFIFIKLLVYLMLGFF